MRRCLGTLACLGALAVPAAAAADGTHQVIDQRTVRIGPFVRTDTTVQAGAEPVDRFVMHRLRRLHGGHRPRGVLLVLGPLANRFDFFETDEHGIYARSFGAFFAALGWEVWGYSPRGTGLAAGACESGAADCAPMADWGLAAFVDDVAFIRDRIAARHPGIEPVLGGYSLGGAAVIATLNAHPDDYAAAFVVEGALYSEDPEILDRNVVFCADLDALIAAGFVFDGESLPVLRLLATLAGEDPDGETPFPGFPPGFTNHQVLVFALAVPQPDDPFNQTPDFIRCAGSVEEDRFFHCSDPRTVAHLLLFNDYFDLRSVRDLTCGMGGDRTHTDDLGAFDGPVLLIGGELGFAGQNLDLAGLLVAADVTVENQPGFGHADHWFSVRHRRFVEGEILRWLVRTRWQR